MKHFYTQMVLPYKITLGLFQMNSFYILNSVVTTKVHSYHRTPLILSQLISLSVINCPLFIRETYVILFVSCCVYCSSINETFWISLYFLIVFLFLSLLIYWFRLYFLYILFPPFFLTIFFIYVSGFYAPIYLLLSWFAFRGELHHYFLIYKMVSSNCLN